MNKDKQILILTQRIELLEKQNEDLRAENQEMKLQVEESKRFANMPIKTKADAESKEKYNNNYLNIKKNTTDKKISGLIKKSMEETRNNGKIIL